MDTVKRNFVKKNFKDLKTHRVEITGDNSEKTQYSITLHPLEGTEHRYTLILLHGIGYNAHGFYKWIN